MKMVLAAAFLVAVVLVSAKKIATQSVDPQPEGRITVAQKFCPNGRC